MKKRLMFIEVSVGRLTLERLMLEVKSSRGLPSSEGGML